MPMRLTVGEPHWNAHADVIAHGLWHWPGDRFSKTPPTEARQVIHQGRRCRRSRSAHFASHLWRTLRFSTGLCSRIPAFADALPHVLVAYLKSQEAQAAPRAQCRISTVKFFAKLQAPASVDVATAMSHRAPLASPPRFASCWKKKVKLLFGTDTPSGDGSIGNPPGLNGRLELSRWAEAGVPLSTILRASTLDNAVAFGLSKDCRYH